MIYVAKLESIAVDQLRPVCRNPIAGRLIFPAMRERTEIKLTLIKPTLAVAASRSDLKQEFIQNPRNRGATPLSRQSNLIGIGADWAHCTSMMIGYVHNWPAKVKTTAVPFQTLAVQCETPAKLSDDKAALLPPAFFLAGHAVLRAQSAAQAKNLLSDTSQCFNEHSSQPGWLPIKSAVQGYHGFGTGQSASG